MAGNPIDTIPKSRITIRYKTEINGKKKQREIPLRLLVMGDLSRGKSKDIKEDLSKRQVRGLDGQNLDATMADMDIKLNLKIENKIDPKAGESLNIELPINSIKSFNPAIIAENVPEIKSLLTLRQLIKELETEIDNNKYFRENLGSILIDNGKLEAVRQSHPNIKHYLLKSGENNERVQMNQNSSEKIDTIKGE